MLTAVEASLMVGAIVAPSIGSTAAARSGFSLRQRPTSSAGSAPSSPTAARKSASAASSAVGRGMRWIRSMTGPSLTSALSAAPGVDAWPLFPWTVTAKAAHRFSPTPTV